MTIDPRFTFYRDHPSPDSCEPLEVMADEAARAHAQREARYPELVRKGRMSPADAERELRVMGSLADQYRRYPAPGEEMPPRRGIATWSEQIDCLRREILLRRAAYPDAGDRRLLVMESLHFMHWTMTWHDEAIAARAAVEVRAAA